MGMQLILRWRYVGLALVLLVTLTACSPIVFIPDKALEQAIRTEIRKPLSVFLTKRDLSGLRKLSAADLNIVNLEGLQFCENLTQHNLTGNSIRSIDQLARLTKLIQLHLCDNQIMNIEAISGLLALEYLDLSGEGNAITDWRHLEANVLNGGLSFEAVVKVPSVHTFDNEGNPLPGFKGAYNAMRDMGVVIVDE